MKPKNERAIITTTIAIKELDWIEGKNLDPIIGVSVTVWLALRVTYKSKRVIIGKSTLLNVKKKAVILFFGCVPPILRPLIKRNIKRIATMKHETLAI